MNRRPVTVLDVVGLTPRLLEHMPAVRAVADEGFATELGTVLPAVTCSAQATLLTGALPREHGIVGNGWYFRDLGEVLLWRQHDRLVQAERIWDTARRLDPDHRTANLFWWYAMGARADVTATPRPVYHADGRKDPDFYVRPPELHEEWQAELGTFPLFNYWGPTAGIASSEWIVRAAQLVQRTRQPDLLWPTSRTWTTRCNATALPAGLDQRAWRHREDCVAAPLRRKRGRFSASVAGHSRALGREPAADRRGLLWMGQLCHPRSESWAGSPVSRWHSRCWRRRVARGRQPPTRTVRRRPARTGTMPGPKPPLRGRRPTMGLKPPNRRKVLTASNRSRIRFRRHLLASTRSASSCWPRV